MGKKPKTLLKAKLSSEYHSTISKLGTYSAASEGALGGVDSCVMLSWISSSDGASANLPVASKVKLDHGS